MIISHKHKFIFIKTRKTAGTSIEVFLSQWCGEEDTITPIYPSVEPHQPKNYQGFWNPLPEILQNNPRQIGFILRSFLKRQKFYNHIAASTVQCRISRNVWDSYFKFCVERNPWDKTLSHYHMVNNRSGGNISFDYYLNQGGFCINLPLYTNLSGELVVDKVIKYESLLKELGGVFHKLNIPFSGSLEVRAKSNHRKDKRSYREIFSTKQKEIVEQAFADEIALHSYEF